MSSKNSRFSVRNTNRFSVRSTDRTSFSHNNQSTRPVARQLTKGMCQKMTKQQYTRDTSKCDIDHTDPANQKCYHDAHNKASKELKKCENLPN